MVQVSSKLRFHFSFVSFMNYILVIVMESFRTRAIFAKGANSEYITIEILIFTQCHGCNINLGVELCADIL